MTHIMYIVKWYESRRWRCAGDARAAGREPHEVLEVAGCGVVSAASMGSASPTSWSARAHARRFLWAGR